MYARVALVSALVIFSMHRHTVLADSLDFDTSGLDDLVKNIESVVDMFGGGADGSCGIKCPEGMYSTSRTRNVERLVDMATFAKVIDYFSFVYCLQR